MQISFVDSTGSTMLPVESTKYTIKDYRNKLVLKLGDSECVTVQMHGSVTEYGSGEYEIPIVLDDKCKCEVVLKIDKKSYKMLFQMENVDTKSDILINNLLNFANSIEESFRYGKSYQLNELLGAIREYQIDLLIVKKPITGYDDQSLLRSISEVVPMIMDICSHPKQSLRTEEAILDVNLVKRINSNTMNHLSSHSEHWKARTLNGLIPNRLKADIFEDEINIYENLFFRMAVDDVLRYVHRQVSAIEETIKQNRKGIDLDKYGKQLRDDKRIQMFLKLMPNYNVEEKEIENLTLTELLNQWKRLEKQFSTVEASQFFRSIDKKKHISRNIHPTNILKKDSRYNALFRLWNVLQRQQIKESTDTKGISGDVKAVVANYYVMYVTVLLLYSFELLGYKCEDDSTFMIHESGVLETESVFCTDNIKYIISCKLVNGIPKLSIRFVEKNVFDFAIPASCLEYKDKFVGLESEAFAINIEKGIIHFYSKPQDDEQRELKKLFRVNQSSLRGLDKETKIAIEKADIEWRTQLESLFSSNKIKDARSKVIELVPVLLVPDKSDLGVDRCTMNMLDSMSDRSVCIIPIELDAYSDKIENEKLFRRILNFGEKFDEEDAIRWGNYNKGIVPVSQSEIYSVQRLMKLISIHTSKLLIQWNQKDKVCPVCGSLNCVKETDGTWKCKNPECGILFGITRCADGCGNDYEWTRPFIGVTKKDVQTNNELEDLLVKESIFDRLTITDFDFHEEYNGEIRYVPMCPICGHRKYKGI